MKRSRRKELKTNVLSVYLQQIYEAAAANATYLIGGVVAVVIVLVVGLYVQHNRDRALQTAWSEYERIRRLNVADEPDALDQARTLAAAQADHPALGGLALELQAGLAYDLALSLTKAEDRARRIKLLEDARAAYEQLLAKSSDRPDVTARALMGLASVEESLAVAGAGDKEKVRLRYQQLLDAGPNPFQGIAGELLDSLDERVQKLELVATRPAEAPAATAPASAATKAAAVPATAPGAATRPTPTAAPAARAAPATQP